MRLLLGDGAPADEVSAADLRRLYAYPDPLTRPYVRATMVSTVDGAATGTDGVSGSVSSSADRRVFSTYRGLADVILVGRATVEAEGYADPEPREAHAEARAVLGQTPAPAMAVVTGSGALPDRLLERPGFLVDENRWRLVVLTTAAAPSEALARLRGSLGEDAVAVVGDERVDTAAAVAALGERGLRRVLCEGGPTLLAQVAAAGVLDELCLTTSPMLVAGASGRVLAGVDVDVPLHLAHLLEQDGTLVARWTT